MRAVVKQFLFIRYQEIMASKNPQYWLEKLSHRKKGYPLGTIAFYGKADKLASKVVVGILLSEKDAEVTFMEKWFQTSTDVRFAGWLSNQTANASRSTFLRKNQK